MWKMPGSRLMGNYTRIEMDDETSETTCAQRKITLLYVRYLLDRGVIDNDSIYIVYPL